MKSSDKAPKDDVIYRELFKLSMPKSFVPIIPFCILANEGKPWKLKISGRNDEVDTGWLVTISPFSPSKNI